MKKSVFLELLETQNAISPIAREELSQDLTLHPEHAQYYFNQAKKVGNSKEYSLENVEFSQNILTDKTALFLGSNTTFGLSSLGESFVDYLWQKDGLIGLKDVEVDTFLTHQDSFQKDDSYISRFQNDLKLYQPDALVIELPELDLNKNVKIGDLADKHYDTKTIIGAVEYMISQTSLLWGCPIILFMNYKNDYKKYVYLFEKVLQLKQKWQIELIDLSTDKEIDIQPTRQQYRDVWLPIFEDKLRQVL